MADGADSSQVAMDVLFVVDTTEKNSDMITCAVDAMESVRFLAELTNCLALGCIAYKDFCDKNPVEFSGWCEPSNQRKSFDSVVKFLEDQKAEGGGDFPEATKTALANVHEHRRRKTAVFHFTNAPPHLTLMRPQHRLAACQSNPMNFELENIFLVRHCKNRHGGGMPPSFVDICDLLVGPRSAPYPKVDFLTLSCDREGCHPPHFTPHALYGDVVCVGGQEMRDCQTVSRLCLNRLLQHVGNMGDIAVPRNVQYHAWSESPLSVEGLSDYDGKGFLPTPCGMQYRTPPTHDTLRTNHLRVVDVDIGISELMAVARGDHGFEALDRMCAAIERMINMDSQNEFFMKLKHTMCVFNPGHLPIARMMERFPIKQCPKEVEEWIALAASSNGCLSSPSSQVIVLQSNPGCVGAGIDLNARLGVGKNSSISSHTWGKIQQFVSALQVQDTITFLARNSSLGAENLLAVSSQRCLPLGIPDTHLFMLLLHLANPGVLLRGRALYTVAAMCIQLGPEPLAARAAKFLSTSRASSGWLRPFDLSFKRINFSAEMLGLMSHPGVRSHAITSKEACAYECLDRMQRLFDMANARVRVEVPYMPMVTGGGRITAMDMETRACVECECIVPHNLILSADTCVHCKLKLKKPQKIFTAACVDVWEKLVKMFNARKPVGSSSGADNHSEDKNTLVVSENRCPVAECGSCGSLYGVLNPHAIPPDSSPTCAYCQVLPNEQDLSEEELKAQFRWKVSLRCVECSNRFCMPMQQFIVPDADQFNKMPEEFVCLRCRNDKSRSHVQATILVKDLIKGAPWILRVFGLDHTDTTIARIFCDGEMVRKSPLALVEKLKDTLASIADVGKLPDVDAMHETARVMCGKEVDSVRELSVLFDEFVNAASIPDNYFPVKQHIDEIKTALNRAPSSLNKGLRRDIVKCLEIEFDDEMPHDVPACEASDGKLLYKTQKKLWKEVHCRLEKFMRTPKDMEVAIRSMVDMLDPDKPPPASTCAICFDTFSVCDLVPLCGNLMCEHDVCGSCREEWYNTNGPGKLFTPMNTRCPMCTQAPRREVLMHCNPALCDIPVASIHTVVEETHEWWHAWCQECSKLAQCATKECAEDAPKLEHWMCGDCQANLQAELMGRECPGCGISTSKTAGCDHMTCRACDAHWCWGCRKQFARSGLVYDHMTDLRCPNPS